MYRHISKYVSNADVRYIGFGIITSIISIALLTFFIEGFDWNRWTAYLVQAVITTGINYVLICKYVFIVNPWRIAVARENFAARFAMIASAQLSYFGLSMAGWPYIWAFVASSGSAFFGNIILAKYVVFRRARIRQSAEEWS